MQTFCNLILTIQNEPNRRIRTTNIVSRILSIQILNTSFNATDRPFGHLCSLRARMLSARNSATNLLLSFLAMMFAIHSIVLPKVSESILLLCLLGLRNPFVPNVVLFVVAPKSSRNIFLMLLCRLKPFIPRNATSRRTSNRANIVTLVWIATFVVINPVLLSFVERFSRNIFFNNGNVKILYAVLIYRGFHMRVKVTIAIPQHSIIKSNRLANISLAIHKIFPAIDTAKVVLCSICYFIKFQCNHLSAKR
nr:MAG TPA: hypothetical protein [Bacteriophage sp.]